MSFHSSPFPSPVGAGAATATSGLNKFSKATEELSPGKASFFDKPSGKSPDHALSTKVEKACRTFIPFGGSWDYSEVD